jgi:hypothetical protein
MDMERRYRQLQRATVARSALDVIALIFLFSGFAFWGVAFWQLLGPPALLSLLSIQAIVLALAFSLAAPLLLSMLVPTTPAGQLLQKTQWATIGFYVILGAALFLVYQSEQLIETWLYAQSAIAAAHWEVRLAVVLTIAFVVIPALAWVQLTPERWVASVQQAHAVKKLEMQQRGELAIIKASLVRAELLAARGWAELLPLEKEEAIQSLRGLLMASSDSMRAITRTLGVSADLERSIMQDDEIADQLDYVTRSIDVLPEFDRPATPRSVPAEGTTTALVAHQDAAPVPAPPRNATAGKSAPQRPAAPRSAPQRYAVEYETASAGLTGAWTVHALADVLGVAERTARDRLNVWLEDGRAAPSDTKGRFCLTEREVR